MRPLIVLIFTSLALSLTIPINYASLPNIPSRQQSLAQDLGNTTPDRNPGLRINHGTVINANKSRIAHEKPSYNYALQIEKSPYCLLERYSDELFAIGLLLLVPITLGIVEAVDWFSRSITVEQYPERGREKHRMGSLRERKAWVLKRKERESKIKQSRSWWKSSRGSAK